MNEMRHPWHFWKSFTLAEGIVLFMYLLYGTYVYALQGQYTLPVAYQGVSSYVWQSIGNGLVSQHLELIPPQSPPMHADPSIACRYGPMSWPV